MKRSPKTTQSADLIGRLQNNGVKQPTLAELACEFDVSALSDTSEPAQQRTLSELREMVIANPAGRASFERTSNRIRRRTLFLSELRQAHSLTQSQLADLLGTDQPEVSRMEQRSDLLLSSVKRYVESTGGTLRLVADYPDTEPIEIVFQPT